MRVSGMTPETTGADLRRLLERYYSTVKDIKMGKGWADITFGMSGERDKALVELQGAVLLGARLTLTKHAPASAGINASKPRKRGRDGSLADDEIQVRIMPYIPPVSPPRDESLSATQSALPRCLNHTLSIDSLAPLLPRALVQSMLLERETFRRRRDYGAADALVTELRASGVLVDARNGTWRAADGRTGMLPSAPPAAGWGGSTVGTAAVDPGRVLYARLCGDDSLGTHTLKRILGPFRVEEVWGTANGSGQARIEPHSPLATSTRACVTLIDCVDRSKGRVTAMRRAPLPTPQRRQLPVA